MNSTPQFADCADSDNTGSTIQFPDDADPSPPDIESLRRLSDHLLSIRQSPAFDFFADARIVVGGKEFPVHRCILSARSPFFRDFFTKENTAVSPIRVEMKELVGEIVVGFEAFALVVEYLYSGRLGQIPKEVCLCLDEECSHAGCRPAVDFMLEVLSASFVFKISELVSLFQRHLLDILDKVAIDDIPVILSVANFCSRQCEKLVIRCIEIVAESDIEVVTLEKSLPPNIFKKVMVVRQILSFQGVEVPSSPGKHARKFYQALDSDDIELVKMLLKEGNISLDDALALHYAVAHCDVKTTMELLDLNPLDVNHMNSRGYSVLHVAAMRREAKIIISLLTKGARPSDLTWDGRKAAQISKRLTRSVDYYMTTVNGKEKASPDEGRLCIGILEHAERRNPLMGEAFSLEMAGDDHRGILLYLENRVALAKMLFPREAKVAMDIAQVNGTMEFTFCSLANQRSTVDLNKTPNYEEHLARIKALSRTVELGKSFFPRCSAVLDKIMDDDLTDYASLGNSASNEQMKTYLELHDIVNKAFFEDKEKRGKSALSPASSAASAGPARKRNRVRV